MRETIEKIKCDACGKRKVAGLEPRTFQLCDYEAAPIVTFVGDVCDAFQEKLIDTMQKFLHVKPQVGRGE